MDQITIKNIIKAFVKNFSLLLTENMLYPPRHPNVVAQTNHVMAAAEVVFNVLDEIFLTIREGQFVFDGIPLYELKHTVMKTTQLFESKNILCIRFTKNFTQLELSVFTGLLADKSHALDAEALQIKLGTLDIFNISVEKKSSLNKDDDKENFLPAEKIYGSSIEANKLIFNTLLKENTIPMDIVDKVAQDITNIITRDKTYSLALSSLRDYDDYTFTHSANVAILSVALASTILNDAEILTNLARAALLHDIGKIRIPQEILNKPCMLNEEEWRLVRNHPILGAKILEQQKEINKLAVIVAYQHHMKYDKSGYPDNETSCGLHPLVLIVNICDVYDAITSKRVYKKPFPPDKALSIMMRLIGCDFEPRLFKIFIQLIGVYPPGTLVRLNTKEIAVTRKVQTQALLLPEVKIIANESGSLLEKPLIINLSDEQQNSSNRSIEAVLDPKEENIDIISYI
ncbi:MAG: HD-GYP domain-containing protein [Candidatus Omnitrophica bacterium]|nr:HD-GYP domain-containing protein [Candidatus Omnitrophota bacterium]